MGGLVGVLGTIRESLGKTLALTGVLPAFSLWMVWGWFQARDEGLRVAAERMVGGLGGADVTAEILLVAFVVIFFAGARGAIMAILESPPLPHRLSAWIMERRDQRREEAARAESRARALVTVLRWHRDRFQRFSALPEGLAPAAFADAAESSCAGRKALESALKEGAPKGDLDSVEQGLLDLRAATGGEEPLPPELSGELAAWTKLAEDASASAILEKLRTRAYRDWIRASSRLAGYPRAVWSAPTALGNARAKLDEYADDRYGVDTGTLWNRIWPLLDETAKAEISAARVQVESALNMSVALGLAVVAMLEAVTTSTWSLLRAGTPVRPDWAGLALIVVTAAATVVAYRAGVFSFRGLASRIQALIDLHRLAFLQAFGYGTPASVEEEQRWLAELKSFFTAAGARPAARRIRSPQG